MRPSGHSVSSSIFYREKLRLLRELRRLDLRRSLTNFTEKEVQREHPMSTRRGVCPLSAKEWKLRSRKESCPGDMQHEMLLSSTSLAHRGFDRCRKTRLNCATASCSDACFHVELLCTPHFLLDARAVNSSDRLTAAVARFWQPMSEVSIMLCERASVVAVHGVQWHAYGTAIGLRAQAT